MEAKHKYIQAAVRPEIKNTFEDVYVESGANSKGEFIKQLLDRFTSPENVIEKEVEVVKEMEVVKEVPVPISLGENQLLVNLSPIQRKLLVLASEDNDTFKQQQSYAVSESILEKYGAVFSPLVEGENRENMGKILINVFSYNLLESQELVPVISDRDVRNINQELQAAKSEREKMLNLLKSLTLEERRELLEENEVNSTN